VVENGEVIAMMDITELLYEAIWKMEKIAQQGQAIAAAGGNVEQQMGTNSSGTRNNMHDSLVTVVLKISSVRFGSIQLIPLFSRWEPTLLGHVRICMTV
jgi:hypothetical protein